MKIVLAMDTSSASQTALDQVAARPWPAGSYFEVVSVVEPSHLWTTSEAAVEAANRAHEVVARAAERLSCGCKEVTGAVFTGDPKTVILDRACALGADLLIVGSHGASAAARLLLGNVAASVLRYAACSVEVARSRKPDAGGYKLLLATDGSAYSEQAAKSVAMRPWPQGTQVRVLSVVELVLPAARALFEVPIVDAAFLEKARGAAMQRAQDAITRAHEVLYPPGLDLSDSISVLADTPQALILQEAAEWDADLIVLGSHGRRGMDRFLVGSVSEGVANHAHCSVEIVR